MIAMPGPGGGLERTPWYGRSAQRHPSSAVITIHHNARQAVQARPIGAAIRGLEDDSRSSSVSETGAAMRQLDVHARDLRAAGSDPAHTRRPDRFRTVAREQQATVGRLKLRDRGNVVVHSLLDRQPEPIPRLQPVVPQLR